MARVAVVQMVSSDNVTENLSGLDVVFAKAQDEGAQLLVLPENFAFMGKKETDKLSIAEDFGFGKIQDTISYLAKSYHLWVIAGSIPIKHTPERVKSSSVVYDAEGASVARYDKIHLFDVRVSSTEAHQESFSIQRGEHPVMVDTPVGRVGLSICYDLRFPELYQQLMLSGAELFAVPSAFTEVTGKAHWQTLLKARAIENLAYVLAPNQGGAHASGRRTYGHSMIIEPWGKVVCEQGTGPGITFADIDLPGLRRLREQFPCHEHHVLSLNR